MTTRMLIDARHREETRVAVVKGNRIEEFDFESAERKQLKGNIYLAKVTRVEPSLQAAFIEYGGNRHGFLAFSEIHPDYYQIPKEDREALLREEAEHAAEEAALRAEHDDDHDLDMDEAGDEFGDGFGDDENGDGDEHDADRGSVELVERDEDEGTSGDDESEDAEGEHAVEGDGAAPRRRRGRGNGQDDQVEALRQRRMSLRRRYKIQDVIRRRQVLLVQVVKEERGNKGAALTTYLSLAGRYCVLMPNTSHGGGISRKISNAGDRKRLKSIMADLQLPPSMGCIVRTAGLQRTKTEIKRDFDYLARLWDGIREDTLKSAAPALVHGDSDLIKRAVRDIYNKDIDEVIVEGEDGYRQAKQFMRMLMPSHAKKVKHYADAVPLFQRAHVEDQLAAMYNPVVQLKSGGYLVINPTEALVSIDINSGRSTREHNIEQTATATNLEAAQEIARQLRLRDMAGLVVIDFIDMDNGSNVRKVEKAMKEALKNDRARIQVGRISSFGLMEMSRQRLRTGVLEASTRTCPHCEGTGLVRTAASAGLSALRMIEDEAARGRGSCLTLRASTEAAVYVLNRKRADIAEIEDRYGVQVEVLPDGEQEGARMTVEASGPPPAYAPKMPVLVEEEDEDDLIEEVEDEEDDTEAEAEEDQDEAAESPRRAEPREGDASDNNGRRRRRRRGRRGRTRPEEGEGETEASDLDRDESDDAGAAESLEDGAEAEQAADEQAADEQAADGQPSGEGRRRRGRRGRRGGRRDAERGETSIETNGAEASGDEASGDALVIGDEAGRPSAAETPALAPVPAFAGEPAMAADAAASPELPLPEDAAEAEPVPTAPEAAETPAPRTRRRPRARAAAEEAAPAAAEVATEEPAPKPRRSRRKAADEPVANAAPATEQPIAEEPAKPRRGRRRKADDAPTDAPVADISDATDTNAPVPQMARPANDLTATPAADTADAEVAEATEVGADDADSGADAAAEQAAPRRGWWQRTFGA